LIHCKTSLCFILLSIAQLRTLHGSMQTHRRHRPRFGLMFMWSLLSQGGHTFGLHAISGRLGGDGCSGLRNIPVKRVTFCLFVLFKQR